MKTAAIKLILVAGALAAGTASADEPATQGAEKPLQAMDIVRKANYVAYYQGADGRAKVRMTITDSQNRSRTREFTILRWDRPDPRASLVDDPDKRKEFDPTFCEEQKFYVYFERPSDVNKMGFLVYKHLDKDDDRWLYLPALDLVKRIAATDKRTSFVGSDFLYEDVSGRNISLDNHELVQTTATFYVIKSTPKDPKSLDLREFSYYQTWIHRKTFLVVQTRYFDPQGKLYRQYSALNVEETDGYSTVVKSRMLDLRNKSNTLLEYPSVRYNIGLPESIFTERYLKSPPTEHLK